MNHLLHTVLAGILTLSALTVPGRSHARYPEGTTDPPTDSLQIEQAARRYFDHKSKSWDRYQERSARTTKRFLKKLQKQEDRIIKRLKATDSARYGQLSGMRSISADSLQRQLADSSFTRKVARGKSYTNRGIDSLRKLSTFAERYGAGQGEELEKLEGLQGRQAIEQYSQKVLQERSKALQKLLAGTPMADQAQKLVNINGQYRQQLNYWKQLQEEPDAVEEQAMEYLRGIEGFEEHINGTNNTNGALSGRSAEELQQMGYQTKAAVNQQLQQQFGGQLEQVQQKAVEQLQQYSEKLGGKSISKIKEAKNTLKEGRSQIKETQNSLQQGRTQLTKPEGFKNPMRGVPFWQRWEWQYNFQTQRASADGNRPVMLQTGLNATYKQTEIWSIGIGMDGSIGLGQGWKQLQLSYEGLTGRVFLDYKLLWGISVQGGYEKSLRPMDRSYTQLQDKYGNASNLRTQMGLLQDGAYLGLMKSYRINSKLQGTLLIGYNFLNDKTNISSPWIIRLGWKL